MKNLLSTASTSCIPTTQIIDYQLLITSPPVLYRLSILDVYSQHRLINGAVSYQGVCQFLHHALVIGHQCFNNYTIPTANNDIYRVIKIAFEVTL